jgi:hypothetical protein
MIEDASLVSGGDCLSHWHSTDRQPTQDFLHGLQSSTKTRTVSTAYNIRPDDDVVLVSGLTTVVLPTAKNGQEYTVVRVGTSAVTVSRSGSDTINGGTSLTLSTQWAARTFKAVSGGWVIINGYL